VISIVTRLAELLIIRFVRRFVTILACFAFAASLYASVPAASSADRFHPVPAGVMLDHSQASQLSLTAVPMDKVSFYLEFYGTEHLPAKAERKGGFLRWFTSAVKKTAQKVNLFPN